MHEGEEGTLSIQTDEEGNGKPPHLDSQENMESLLRNVMEGRIEGNRTRGRR